MFLQFDTVHAAFIFDIVRTSQLATFSTIVYKFQISKNKFPTKLLSSENTAVTNLLIKTILITNIKPDLFKSDQLKRGKIAVSVTLFF